MLQDVRAVMGCSIGATDGEIGAVRDIYFDDHTWTIRYLVVETGAWLNRRKVLISPDGLGAADFSRRQVPALITTEQVRTSPHIDTDKPVSRQHESLIVSHYRQPKYWESAGPPTLPHMPAQRHIDAQFGWSDDGFATALSTRDPHRTVASHEFSPHLRSCQALTHYGVVAQDEEVGKIEAFLFSKEDWRLRYLIVRTGHWWSGHRTLAAVDWIQEVNWLESRVGVDIPRETLTTAPIFNPEEPLGRAWEISFFKHCGRDGYWESDATAVSQSAP